jgi:hypothetical protein
MAVVEKAMADFKLKLRDKRAKEEEDKVRHFANIEKANQIYQEKQRKFREKLRNI